MLAALALLVVLADAPADAPGTHLEVTTTGYLDNRYTYAHVNIGTLVPTQNQPTLLDTAEGNLQLRLRYGAPLTVFSDLSFLWQDPSLYYGKNAAGQEIRIPSHDVPAYHPEAVINELYATWAPIEHLDLTLGKKRVVWGAGFAENPTDLLNPPKIPPTPPSSAPGPGWREWRRPSTISPSPPWPPARCCAPTPGFLPRW